MVPGQRFNEMKPNSGVAGAEPGPEDIFEMAASMTETDPDRLSL
jgi:hypothetical protein